MADITTMKELSERAVPENQTTEFRALVAAIRKRYPDDWESWKVRDVSFNELFGDHVSSKIEAKLRFALPTEDIKEIFFGPDGQLSERGFRESRRKLLNWPLGRAILYSPHSFVTKIHPSPLAYETFMATVTSIKPLIRSIRGPSAETDKTPLDTEARKRRSTSQASEVPAKSPKNSQLELLTNMADLLSKQTQALDNLTKRVDTFDQLRRCQGPEDKSDESDDELNQSFGSAADSTTEETSWQAPPLSSPGPSHAEDRETTLRQTIVNAQRELAQLSSVKPQNPANEDEDSWDFNPVTLETEPKITKADPKLVEQAISCQRLGDESWKNVRYADVQKIFQATPAFCALKVNNHLAINTPSWQSLAHLEKSDLTLGAIAHGLLQQREALKDAYKSLSEPARKEVKTKLLDDSKFRKITDQLLQYTCGRRAEAIQARRETYKSTNKVLNDMLHDIPPSTTHLFSEEKLAEVHANCIQEASRKTKIQSFSIAKTSCTRAALVARKPNSVLRDPSRSTVRFLDYRRLRRGVGRNIRHKKTFRYMENLSESLALQSKRVMDIIRSLERRNRIPLRKNRHVSNRQSNRCRLHQETGGHKIPKAVKNRIRNPEHCSKEQDNYCSEIPPGSIQRPRRQTIETQTTARMAPKYYHHKGNFYKDGSSTNRSVRVERIGDREEVRERRRQRREERIHRCFQQTVGIQTCLAFSTSSIDTSYPPASQQLTGPLHTRVPDLEQSLLETRSEETSDNATAQNSQPQGSPDRPHHKPTSEQHSQLIFGGMENTGWEDEIMAWSPQERDLLQTAWRTSTLKTYKPAWNSWLKWSAKNGINGAAPAPSDLARYLIFLSNVKKLSASTILVHKSTVATFTKPSNSESISGHPLVRKTLKAIALKSPPTYKNNSTWQISDLIEWMTEQDIDETNLFQVSQHVATLLLLASGRRIHDLTLLHINQDQCSIDNNSITLWPAFGSKTDNSSYRQSGWLLKKCDKKKFDLCHWIPTLIKTSHQRRKANPTVSNLFITTRGRVKSASRTVIAGWIRLLLGKAHINSTPGSFRSAVSSDNWSNRNMNIDEVLQRGNWRNSKTFLKHYFKEAKRNENQRFNGLSILFEPV